MPEATSGLISAIHVFIQCSLLLTFFISLGFASKQIHRANTCNMKTKMVMEKFGIVFLDGKKREDQNFSKVKTTPIKEGERT